MSTSVIKLLILNCHKTNDVSLSKKPPSPIDNFEGWHDLMKYFTHFVPSTDFMESIKSQDFVYGYDKMLKITWMTIPQSRAQIINTNNTDRGIRWYEVTKMYKETVSQTTIPPMQSCMDGWHQALFW